MHKKVYIILLYIITITLTSYADTLKIMHQENYYPYAFINDDNESDGIIIDYWKLWAKKKNVNIEFYHSKTPHYLKSIVNGDVDIISGMKFNKKWVDSITYTEYIIKVNTTLFLRKDKKIKSIKDIDFKIATIDNNLFNYKYDTVFDGINFIYYNDFHTFIDDVRHKKIEGFIYDIPIKNASQKTFKVPAGYYKYKILKLDYIRPIIQQNNTRLQQLIIKGFSNISQEELLKIAEKWDIVGSDYTTIIILIISISILIIVIIVFILIIRSHKRNPKLLISNSNHWKDIIEKGESDSVEFKSSLRWDYKQQKPNKNLELVIVKTISAFLNTEGGLLFIGIDDDCKILGIEKDYQSLNKKNSDGFILSLINIVNQSLGKIYHKNISINIVSIDKKDVCVVSIEKSSQPVFLKKSDTEEFYIRTSVSSQPMSISEAYKYIKTHWDE